VCLRVRNVVDTFLRALGQTTFKGERGSLYSKTRKGDFSCSEGDGIVKRSSPGIRSVNKNIVGHHFIPGPE